MNGHNYSTEQERDEMMKAYRGCLGLLKLLRRQLGMTACPFCEHKEGNGTIHTEHRETYVASHR